MGSSSSVAPQTALSRPRWERLASSRLCCNQTVRPSSFSTIVPMGIYPSNSWPASSTPTSTPCTIPMEPRSSKPISWRTVWEGLSLARTLRGKAQCRAALRRPQIPRFTSSSPSLLRTLGLFRLATSARRNRKWYGVVRFSGTWPHGIRGKMISDTVRHEIGLDDRGSIGIVQGVDVGVELAGQLFDGYIPIGTIVEKEDGRTV